jgi:hypothetical protein
VDAAASTVAPAADRVFPALHGLFWLCVNLSERAPVAIVVDDVQWADRASLRFLSYLTGRLEGLAMAVVLGLRTGEPEAQRSLSWRSPDIRGPRSCNRRR